MQVTGIPYRNRGLETTEDDYYIRFVALPVRFIMTLLRMHYDPRNARNDYKIALSICQIDLRLHQDYPMFGENRSCTTTVLNSSKHS